MRIRIFINTILNYRLTAENRVRLEAVYPEGFGRGGGFQVTMYADESRAPSVREALDHTGMVHWTPDTPFGIRNTYRVRRTPVFDDQELAAARYVELLRTVRVDSTLTTRRMIVIRPRELERLPTFVQAWYSTVVRDSTRQALDSQGFRKLKFGETMPGRFRNDMDYDRLLDWSKFGGPWWELMSEVKLPNSRYDRHAEDYLPAGAPWDTPMDGRLHFTESDLDPLGDFDIAWGECEPWVVSQRFYQFCQSQGWTAEWRPVAIDSE